MAPRAGVDYRVVGVLIAGGLLAGVMAAAVIAGLFVVVVEESGLAHRFGHHGVVLNVLLAVPTITGAIYVPLRWRALALKPMSEVGRRDGRSDR